MKIRKSILKSIILEVLNEEYEDKFKSKLAKYNVDSPAELSDDDKKKFFDELDSEHVAKDECGIQKKGMKKSRSN